MSKKKPLLVPDKDRTRISDLSAEEESRLLHLADIALHNNLTETPTVLMAGTRAKEDHHNLLVELQREAERIRNPKRAA